MKKYLDELKVIKKETEDFYTYRYITDIVFDEKTESTYGSGREGYERFKKEVTPRVLISGVTSLRAVEADCEVKFIAETLHKGEDVSASEYAHIFQRAVEDLYNTLKVNNKTVFGFWLDEQLDNIELDPHDFGFYTYYKGRLRMLKDILERYENDELYRQLIDRIKE